MNNDKIDELLRKLHEYAMDVDPELGLPLLHSHSDSLRAIVAEWAREEMQFRHTLECDMVKHPNCTRCSCSKEVFDIPDFLRNQENLREEQSAPPTAKQDEWQPSRLEFYAVVMRDMFNQAPPWTVRSVTCTSEKVEAESLAKNWGSDYRVARVTVLED